MDNYQNRQPPEGINTSPGHPLLTLLKLLAGIVLILFAAAWLLGVSGAWLASLVPFEREVQISAAYPQSELDPATHPELRAYLDDLSARLTPALDLPAHMNIRLHYQNENTKNAFATIGGNILLYRGLLEQLPNENSLAMLIAHEMAHIKLRHPIRSAGEGLAINTGMKLLMGYSGVDILGNAGLYTQLHFSRAMETAADEEALAAVYNVYGHVRGAVDLFRTLQNISGFSPRAAFFSTHPLDEQRIARLTTLAETRGWLDSRQAITPLPANFKQWLSSKEIGSSG